ncbi:hypothetical protein J437_LFUL001214 [Ladona fulva]|uniref:Ig-like domain-containing protein n=1 Tax=Ladona fulva TaxID=123851 RepID=A0A8K0JVC4_LADFU|nr:hypothetical protein J437_LFUL001214 [Ladona fulva]
MAVNLNKDATLQCIVSGMPPPVISWVFGDKLLASGPKYQISSDGSSLKIIKSGLGDEGTYKCKASGPRNSESTADIKFRIGRPPTAKHLLLNDSIELEHDGTFPCESEYNPEDALYPGMKTKISWQRESGSLDFSRHKVLTSGELKVKAAEITDKGVYICTLQNDFGKSYTRLNLEVKGIIPPIMENVIPEYVHFIPGDTIVLWCNATGKPEPKIRWSYRKDDSSEPEEFEDGYEDEGAIMIKGRKLTLYNAILAYEGIFSCVAENGAGITPPKDYSLKMIGGPPVLIDDGKPTKVKVTAGDDYTFHCSTENTEGTSYRWIKDGKYLIDRSFPGYFTLSKDHSSLTLHSTLPDYHSGAYKCIASNGVGSATKKFSISVGNPIARNRVI